MDNIEITGVVEWVESGDGNIRMVIDACSDYSKALKQVGNKVSIKLIETLPE